MAFLMASAFSTHSAAQAGPPAQPQAGPPGAGAPRGFTLPPPRPGDPLSNKAAAQWNMLGQWASWPDQAGSGPFPATYDIAPGGLEYVVYQPKDLAAATRNRKLYVYIWGNGGCSRDGATARYHLTEIASHGYVAIAPGKILSGPKAAPAPAGAQGPAGMAEMMRNGATSDKMIAALDWILAENKREGSPYFGLIDPGKVAIAGNSCGGLIAMKAAMDPRAKVLDLENSGVFGGVPAMPAGMPALPPGALANSPMMSMKKEDLAKFHTPVLYIEGGPDDISQPNALDDFSKISNVPVFLADHPGAGHVGLFLEPNGEATKVEMDWLAWHLDGDLVAAETFVGTHCVLCRDFRWKVYRKGME